MPFPGLCKNGSINSHAGAGTWDALLFIAELFAADRLSERGSYCLQAATCSPNSMVAEKALSHKINPKVMNPLEKSLVRMWEDKDGGAGEIRRGYGRVIKEHYTHP